MSLFGNTGASSASGGSSLFGNAGAGATNTGGGSGLFGSAGGGGATAPSSAPGGGGGQGSGLFGNLNTAATTSAPAGGLFGNAPSGAAPSGGMFGQAGSTAAPSGSLFGSTLAGTNPTGGPSTTGGFYGGNPRPADFVKNDMHSADWAQKQATLANPADASVMVGQQAFSTAYFQSLLERNKKRAREAEEKGGVEGVPGLQLGLGDISKRIRELGRADAQSAQQRSDTGAHYLLAGSGVNPGSTFRDLKSFNATRVAAPAASVSNEFDPDSHKYVEQLQHQATLKMISEGLNRAQRDFDAYLEANIDLNWEAQKRRVYEHFGLARASNARSVNGTPSQASFGRSSRRGRQSMMDQSTATPTKGNAFGLQKSVIGSLNASSPNPQLFGESPQKAAAAPTAMEDRYLREKEEKFAEKVQNLNEARLRDASFSVLREFESVEGAAVAGDSPTQLCDAYRALIELTEEGSESKALKMRHFKDDYLDDSPTSTKSFRMRKRILDGSRRALEKQFYDSLTTLVARNPKEASLGGIPSTINHVRGYVRIRHARKDLVPDGVELQMIGDDHCWALLFYLLRSGHVKEGAKYVADNKAAFGSLDRNFLTYITSYASTADNRLTRALQDKISSEYQQRLRISPENSLDPYRMACYKIIGRCDLSKRSIEGIQQGVEDWMWLQFVLARESNRAEDFAGEAYFLEDIRDTVKEIGQRHFAKGASANDASGSGYGTYFYLQILAGMFESAVSYLYQHAYVSAVHFAIALDFYGLLRVSPFDASETDLLTYTTHEASQINFGRMLGYYTRDFRAANAVAAADYLCLIHLDSDLPAPLGKSQSALCHEALRELVLETREFAALLGDIRGDGSRIRGAIEARLPLIGLSDQEQFLRTVTLQAAAVADDAGRTTDAVLLYHLSEDYDSVIATANRALSEAVAVDLGGQAMKVQPVKKREPNSEAETSSFSLTAVDDPATLAQNFVDLYNRDASFYQRVRPQNRVTCGILLRMAEARRRVEGGAWADAIEIITSLSILPMQAQGSVSTIRALSQNLSTLPNTVSRLVGPLLLWAMTAIANQREVLRLDERGTANGGDGAAPNGGGYDSEARKALRDQLVGQGKDLMVFAGLVKLRLSKGVWDGIVGGAGELGVY